MDIDFREPKVIRWLVAVLLIALIVPGFFLSTFTKFTYPARQDEIASLEARHQTLSRDLEKARLLVRNLARVEKEYQILHQQWQVAQTLLPETNEMPNLLRKVTAAGQQSGVDFTLFRPQAPIPQAFYSDNPVEVKIQGGYHQTGVFLSRLANLNRIVNVSALKMKGLDDQENQPFTVETALTLTAYTQGVGPVADPEASSEKLAAAQAEPAQASAH